MRFTERGATIALVLTLLATPACTNPLQARLEEQRAKQRAGALSSGGFTGGKSDNAALYAGYEALRAALAADDFPRASISAKELSAAIGESKRKGDPQGFLRRLETAAGAIAVETDPDRIRIEFGKLSEPVIALSKGSGEAIFDYYFCPMAKGYKQWAQPKGQEISNPYMGEKMSRCGSKVD